MTAMTAVGSNGPKSPEINLRMSKTYFSLKSSDNNTKITHFFNILQMSWMLWKTEFQINSYHTMSSYKNFTNNIDRIVSFEPGETYHGTISKTQYASGNIASIDSWNVTQLNLHLVIFRWNICP